MSCLQLFWNPGPASAIRGGLCSRWKTSYDSQGLLTGGRGESALSLPCCKSTSPMYDGPTHDFINSKSPYLSTSSLGNQLSIRIQRGHKHLVPNSLYPWPVVHTSPSHQSSAHTKNAVLQGKPLPAITILKETIFFEFMIHQKKREKSHVMILTFVT